MRTTTSGLWLALCASVHAQVFHDYDPPASVVLNTDMATVTPKNGAMYLGMEACSCSRT